MRGGAGAVKLSSDIALPLTLLRPASRASLLSPRKRGEEEPYSSGSVVNIKG